MLLKFRKPNELNPERPPVHCREFVPVMSNSVVMLYAGGGTGKSFTSIRVSCEYVKETGRKAALWLTEDAEGENRFRYNSIVETFYPQNKTLLDDRIVFISSRPIPLTELQDNNAVLTEEFWRIRKELSDFSLVVIDPLLQFQGGDENNNTHAGVLMGALKEWADEEQKTLMLIHHAAKTKDGMFRARGAGEWQNGCRSVYLVSRVVDGKDQIDKQRRDELEFELVKDNGLSYYFRNEHTGDLKRSLRIFPEWKKEEPPPPAKMFLSVATHNNAKEPNGFIKVEVDDFYKIHTYVTAGRGYSQYSFRDGYRKGDNNEGGATIICLDFDDGLTIEEAKRKFGKVQCCIVTTRSHQKEKSGKRCDRFRVIIPLQTPLTIPLEDYPDFLNMISRAVGGGVDPSTKDLARFYFSSPEDAFYWYSESRKKLPWYEIYSNVKKERVQKRVEQKIQESNRQKETREYRGQQANTLPKHTVFETKSGPESFESLKHRLSIGEQVTCRCYEQIDHGDLGRHHHSAFIKKADNGNVFYSCSGGRCQHIGTLWCEE